MRAGLISSLMVIVALVVAGIAVSGSMQARAGQPVQLQGQTIALNGVRSTVDQFGQPVLKVNFTIENLGAEDMLVSSLSGFEATLADGTKLNQALCSPGLGSYVAPGHKLRGNICWTTDQASGVTLHYRTTTAGADTVVWELK